MAITGAMPIGLLAIIGLTLLRLRPLLSVHLFVGLLLIPPVMLSTLTVFTSGVSYGVWLDDSDLFFHHH